METPRLCWEGFQRYAPELSQAEVCLLCLGLEDEEDWMAAIPKVSGICPCVECAKGGKRNVTEPGETVSHPCHTNCPEYYEFLLTMQSTFRPTKEIEV